MLKKYKNFVKNEGKFQPPGARALQDFVNLYDAQHDAARVSKVVREAEVQSGQRMRSADALASQGIVDSTASLSLNRPMSVSSFSHTVASTAKTHSTPDSSSSAGTSRSTLSRSRSYSSSTDATSIETVTTPPVSLKGAMRTVLAPHREDEEPASSSTWVLASAPMPNVMPDPVRAWEREVAAHRQEKKLRAAADAGASVSPALVSQALYNQELRPSTSPTCTICFRQCQVCSDPWQRTRSELERARNGHTDRRYGIVLDPCNHIFCGACLAESIYHSLNMAFDQATYGTKLPAYAADHLDGLGFERPEFPVLCPSCLPKSRHPAKPTHVTDRTARLVLGAPNMSEWDHARVLHTRNLVYCPRRGCNMSFDVDDAVPVGPPPHKQIRSHVHCPRCRQSICKACKSFWHGDRIDCGMYGKAALVSTLDLG